MSGSVVNQISYLRTSRNFPDELEQLTVELDRSYIDIANTVNQRTIGIFPTNVPAVTGESYYFTTARQQSLRQIYPFGAIAAGGAPLSIPYKTAGFTQFSRIYATCITDQPDYRPIPYASIAANANIDIRVDSSNIIIAVGASSPNIISGFAVIEWISNA